MCIRWNDIHLGYNYLGWWSVGMTILVVQCISLHYTPCCVWALCQVTPHCCSAPSPVFPLQFMYTYILVWLRHKGAWLKKVATLTHAWHGVCEQPALVVTLETWPLLVPVATSQTCLPANPVATLEGCLSHVCDMVYDIELIKGECTITVCQFLVKK